MEENINTDIDIKTDKKTEKRKLRKEIKEKVGTLTKAYCIEAGDRIQERIIFSEEFKKAKTIFLYLHMEREPATDTLLTEALNAGKKVYVPKCYPGGRMDAVRIRDTEALIPAAYGILEPERIDETALPTEIDLAIIPCVTANAEGMRLGHGAGYYDRFLEAGSMVKMCLCFEKIMTDQIPVTVLDQPMDFVVTEKKTYTRTAE